METHKFLEHVLHEWAYQLSDGTPNLRNPAHIVVLRQVVEKFAKEYQMPEDFVEIYMGNIHTQIDPQVLTETAISGSGMIPILNLDPVPVPTPPEKDEPDVEEPTEEPVDGDEPKIESYIFDKEQMQIIKTGNTVPLSEVVVENKFKCFLTGEVYCETTNGNEIVKLAELTEDE